MDASRFTVKETLMHTLAENLIKPRKQQKNRPMGRLLCLAVA